MFLKSHTGFQRYPLTAGSNDAPQPVAGNPTTFEMRAIPILVEKLAYYVYGIVVTVAFSVTQSGGTGVAIYSDNLIRCVLDSLEVRNAWHGTPVSQNHVKGSLLPIISFIGAGYGNIERVPGPIPAANGTYTRRMSVFVPLASGLGEKPHHTAQLALFYKQAQLVLNFAAASVATAVSPGSSITYTSVKASAVMLPEPEIRLGPGIEWILYRNTAAASQEQILLQAFGNTTGLNGTIPDAGVLWMGAITSLIGQGGSFTADAVTRYSFPWRGQVPSTHIESIVAEMLAALNNGSYVATNANGVAGAMAGFPYILATDLSINAGGAFNPLSGLQYLGLVNEGPNVELTKVQIARGEQAYFLSGPTFSGENLTLAQHARTFNDNMRDDCMRQVVDSGLAKAVLDQSTKLGWVPKLLNKQDTIDTDKLRLLPWRIVRQQPKRVISPRAV